jgi:hypothetical protein
MSNAVLMVLLIVPPPNPLAATWPMHAEFRLVREDHWPPPGFIPTFMAAAPF